MIILKRSSKILTASALAALFYANAATAIESSAISQKSASSEPPTAEIAVSDAKDRERQLKDNEHRVVV